MSRRIAAAGSVVATLTAAGLLAAAAAGTPGLGPTAYLSTLGVPGAPGHLAYTLGVVLAAVAAGLLGWCLGPFRAVAGLLGLAALSLAGSATVPCTPGCPLPAADGFPWNGSVTWADTGHAAAGALAFVALVAAMAVLARQAGDPLVRRASAVGAAVLGTVIAILAAWAVLVRSHGPVTGAAERIAAALALLWVLGVAARLWWVGVGTRTVGVGEGVAMRLEHRFRVPAGPDETWALLLDARALSSAVPGLRLDEILADEVAGSVRIDVGDRCVTYRGEAAFVEKDPADRHLVVEAAGRESEHGRAASATLAVALEPDGDTTTVVLQADLDVEGGAPDADRATVYAAVQRVVDSLAGEVTQRLRHPEPAPWTEDPVHECRPRAHAGVGAAGAGSPPVAADLPAADPLTAAAVTAADPVAADPLVADPVAAADPVVPVDLPAPAGPVNPVDRPAAAAWPVARSLHRRPGSVPPALWLVGLLVLVAMVAWLLRRLRD